jgi:hypothetical protein
VIASLQSSDPQAVEPAVDAWTTVVGPALDPAVGQNGEGCRAAAHVLAARGHPLRVMRDHSARRERGLPTSEGDAS